MKITYEDVLSEFTNFKTRDKYIISNNSEINGEVLEISDQETIKDYSSTANYDLNLFNRFNYISNDTSQTIIMIGNQTCSRRSSEYLPLKILESYLSYGMSAELFKLFREKNGII